MKFDVLKYYIDELRLSCNIPKVASEISKVLKEQQLWIEKPRKSLFRRRWENIVWYLRYGEACIYYNSYGFDVVGFRNPKEYIPYRKFRMERWLEDRPDSLYNNRLCLLRDKVLFASYFGEILGEKYVVQTKGVINADGTVFDFQEKVKMDFASFFSKYNKADLFVKKLYGECGDGCYLIDGDSDINYLSDVMKGSSYIIQDRLEQHQDVNKINPSCINTIRIITIVGRKTKKPHVFAHYMRVGCKAINDNRATGGVGVAIGKDGRMMKYGVGHHKVEVKHSVTGTVYENTMIPYWKEVYSLVLKAHESVLDIPTIGWDVAITSNGPVLIEGNDNWEISGAQDTMGGLKNRWYRLHEK